MRNKTLFFAIASLGALTVSPIVAGIAVWVGALAGLDDGALVILFGGATAGVFAALMTLAGLAAALFFATPEAADGDT